MPPEAPASAGCPCVIRWGCHRPPGRPWQRAAGRADVRCDAYRTPSQSRRGKQCETAGSQRDRLTAGLRPLTPASPRHSMALRVASIDEEQCTEAEAREEFEASTRRNNDRPGSQHATSDSNSRNTGGGSSSSNGSGKELQQEPGSGSRGSSEPFSLDTGQLAKLNGLTADEVFTSGIISSAQASPDMSTQS